MQDANLNRGTPIFKIRILVHFCESTLFKITHFYTQNVFIPKVKLILNTKELNCTLFLHETSCYLYELFNVQYEILACPRNPRQHAVFGDYWPDGELHLI